MATFGYFGFGSLVNRHTLRTNYVHQMPARLKGWRRHWQDRIGNPDPDMGMENFDPHVAMLSIHRDEDCVLDGVLVIDHLQNLPALDKREFGYSRHPIVLGDDLELPSHDPSVELPEKIFVYVADNPQAFAGDGVLLQSYCDAVLQGYLHHFGEAGIEHFVSTTRGFERMLVQDRESPLYARDVQLTTDERVLIDRALSATAVRLA